MSYQLGSTTLLYPKSFKREFIETSAENLSMDGKSTKRVEGRKEKFTLVYQNLTQAQANSILSEYELNQVRTFTVTETNLAISATDVLVDVTNRESVSAGETYLENLTLVLTEVR